MNRVVIYIAKTGLEATDYMISKMVEQYCKDNEYEIVACLSEVAQPEGVSFPMKFAFIGMAVEEDVNTIVTFSKDMIGDSDKSIIDTIGMLNGYDLYIESVSGDMEECYEKMWNDNDTEEQDDPKSKVIEAVSKFYDIIRKDR